MNRDTRRVEVCIHNGGPPSGTFLCHTWQVGRRRTTRSKRNKRRLRKILKTMQLAATRTERFNHDIDNWQEILASISIDGNYAHCHASHVVVAPTPRKLETPVSRLSPGQQSTVSVNAKQRAGQDLSVVTAIPQRPATTIPAFARRETSMASSEPGWLPSTRMVPRSHCLTVHDTDGQVMPAGACQVTSKQGSLDAFPLLSLRVPC